jgi:hypothetical protein
MSLNNIQLTPFVLQDLFKHSLIDLKTEEKTSPKTFATLGNNNKYILILVVSDDTLYLPDDQLNFLMGILNACTLTMEDVAILNIKKNKSATYKTLSEELKPEKIFLFGIQPNDIALPIDFPNYQVQQYNNQIYLTAPILSQLQNDKGEKIKLWNCLKQIFSI